jgi:hypothetical protein
MPHKNYRYYTLGLAALLLVGSAIYVLQDPDSPKAAIVAGKEATNDSAQPSDSLTSTISGEEDVEDVYVWPQPNNYSAVPQREGWEEDIIKLVRTPGGDKLAKAEMLLSRIPALPDEGKLLAMEYATSLIPDDAYLRYRGQLFTLATNDDLKEAVVVDVLSRDDTLRFTTMVEVMKQQKGKMSEEAREILTAYLDQDYGPDASAWEVPVRRFLADNEQ